MTSRQQDLCYIVCVPFCAATVITDRRRTEAKTNPLPWSTYCVFQHTHLQEHLHTHAQTHTGIHTLLCFALIHNGMTLTFPLSYFTHTHTHKRINKTMQTKAVYPWGRADITLSLFSINTVWMLILEFFGSGHSVYCTSSRWTRRGRLCCLMFYPRRILQNVESCLLKWQWSIMTDVVIIGQ